MERGLARGRQQVGHVARALCPPLVKRLIAQVKSSPLGYRLAKGAFWALLGAVISRGLTLVSAILVARILGKESYGQLGIIQSTVGMFGTLAGFGLGMTATKYVAEYRTRDPAKAGRVMMLAEIFAAGTGGAMALALMALAPWLAANTLADPSLTGLLRIGALLLLLNALDGAQAGGLAGFEAFRAIAVRSFWTGVASFPLMVGGVYLAGLQGAVWGLVGSMALSWILNSLALRREARAAGVPYRLQGCMRELPVLWSFSFPAALSSAMVAPITWVCSTMLVNRPGGYAEMGVFNAANTFQTVLLLVANTVGAPLLSMITHERSARHERLGRINMLSTWLIGVLPALPLLCFPEFIQAWFGKDYAGVPFLRTFVAVIFFTCIVTYKQGLSRVLTANSLMWWGVLSNAFWGAVLLAGNVFLVRWGAWGLALAYAIAYAVNTVVFLPLYTVRRLVPMNTVISVEAALIWLVLCGLAAAAWWGAPLPLRALLFPVALVAVAGASIRLIRFSSERRPTS